MTEQECGCVEETGTLGPPVNPPGLDALAYRIGTRASFVEQMLVALGADPVLRRLGTRETADPIIALIDAGASMLDVLTFYQERIANEGFLRTATERLSVLELARAIGYELRPGVAAATMLAFTVTKPPPPVASQAGIDPPVATLAVNTRPIVRVPAGTRAQSVPGQDELPRTFETVAEIQARPEWNAMRVPATMHVPPQLGETELYLAGATTGLGAGDLLLLTGDTWEVRRVSALRAEPARGAIPEHTVVTVDEPLGDYFSYVHALRTRAALFGHNALPWNTLPAPLRVGEFVGSPPVFQAGPFATRANSWADADFSSETTEIFLDRVHPSIVPGSLLVLASTSDTELFEVDEVAEESHADYLLAAQVSRLTVTGDNIDSFAPRTAAVFGGSELLPLAKRPVTQPVEGRVIELAEQVDGLQPGQLIAIRGTDKGAAVSEVRQLAAVYEGPPMILTLTENLTHCYEPDSVRINANVAPATEGETRTEVLGSGDPTTSFQEFVLAGTPLTHVPAPTPSGGLSTLEIRVDGVRWTEVASLYAQPADARIYTTRLADDGVVTVRFGDGYTGARLPSGRDNVVATYRVGVGRGGNLETGRISLLLSRPLGVDEVINPVAATGGDDAEQLAKARQNAPATVLTLGRIVSLRDYEDFARAFAGIGKARASTLWSGERQLVRLIVAAADGTPVDPASALHTNLLAGIDAARHTAQQVLVDSFRPRPFEVELAIAVEPDHLRENVFTAITAALTAVFSFERRDFGQPVAASEILATTQAVPGVRGAVLTTLRFVYNRPTVRTTNPPPDDPTAPADKLLAEPADLLTIAGITLTELTEPLP